MADFEPGQLKRNPLLVTSCASLAYVQASAIRVSDRSALANSASERSREDRSAQPADESVRFRSKRFGRAARPGPFSQRLGVPQPQGGVARTRNQRLAVGAEGQR